MTEIALLTAANLVSDAPDRRADAHLFDIQLDILRRGFAPHGLTLTPVRWIDPIAAIVVALLILKAAWELTWQAAGDLLDQFAGALRQRYDVEIERSVIDSRF